jgi:chain length determinant protein tyrosine kinase EpsG
MKKKPAGESSTGAEVATTVESRLGQQLVAIGKLSVDHIPTIVAAQREKGLLFGEAAISMGFLSHADLQQALSAQFVYPYIDIVGSGLSKLLTVAHKPFGKHAEAYRILRSQLSMRWFRDGHGKIIATTSARTGDRSSEVAANLALSFAQLGERTLLVDANMRASAQRDLFGLPNGAGLSSVLTGRSMFEDALKQIAPFEHLSVLCAGPSPPNPQELLGRIAFSYFMETVPRAFDVVIVDTPPILECSDAQLVVAITKGCILTARLGETSLADIEHAKARISPTGAELLGVVTNA